MTGGSDDLFDKAKERGDIESVYARLGLKLRGKPSDRRGDCPFCGGKAPRFSMNVDKGVFHCKSCGKGGDVIALEQKVGGGSLREAAERLAGDISVPEPAHIREARERRAREREQQVIRGQEYKARRAADLWRTACAAKGTLVETYLRSRGLHGPWLSAALEQLRFSPAVHHSGEAGGSRGAPAMVGLRVAPAGPTGGVHITYLRADGRGKAALDPAKRMLGAGDRDGVPGAVWLTAPTAEGPLVVGEGIESTVSAAILLGVWPCRMVATLSLEAMQGGWATDKWDRVNVDLPRADLERKAFTWPEPENGWGQVLIAVDRDMNPVTRRVRKPMGGTMDRVLDAEARARVCGSLASQQWRAAGAREVAVIAPAPGRDFNDELRACQRLQGMAQ